MDWSSSLEVRTPLGHAQCSPSEHFDAFHPSKKQRLSPLSVTDDAATQFNPTYQGLCGTTKLSETAGENPQYQPCVEQQNVCFGMVRAAGFPTRARTAVDFGLRVDLRFLGL